MHGKVLGFGLLHENKTYFFVFQKRKLIYIHIYIYILNAWAGLGPDIWSGPELVRPKVHLNSGREL